MCFQMRDALRLGNIFLSEGFFSVLMEDHEAIKCIRDELCRFAIVTEPAKTLFGKVRANHVLVSWGREWQPSGDGPTVALA
jgi:hypothetical protein